MLARGVDDKGRLRVRVRGKKKVHLGGFLRCTIHYYNYYLFFGDVNIAPPTYILVLILDMNETTCDIFKHNCEQLTCSHLKWA